MCEKSTIEQIHQNGYLDSEIGALLSGRSKYLKKRKLMATHFVQKNGVQTFLRTFLKLKTQSWWLTP